MQGNELTFNIGDTGSDDESDILIAKINGSRYSKIFRDFYRIEFFKSLSFIVK